MQSSDADDSFDSDNDQIQLLPIKTSQSSPSSSSSVSSSRSKNSSYTAEEREALRNPTPSFASEVRAIVLKSYPVLVLSFVVAMLTTVSVAVLAATDHNAASLFGKYLSPESTKSTHRQPSGRGGGQDRYIPSLDDQRLFRTLLSSSVSTISPMLASSSSETESSSSSSSSSPSSSPLPFPSSGSPPLSPLLSAGIKVKAGYKGNERGNTPLPTTFYEGIHIGVAYVDVEKVLNDGPYGHGVIGGGGGGGDGADEKESRAARLLKKIVEDLDPRPTAVYDWDLAFPASAAGGSKAGSTTASASASATSVSGYVLYYDYKRLQEVMFLSVPSTTSSRAGDKVLITGLPLVQDFLPVTDLVGRLAREEGHFTMHLWYPNDFGGAPDENDYEYKEGDKNDDDGNDKYQHYSIVQDVMPLRSGLQGLRSTGAVWNMV